MLSWSKSDPIPGGWDGASATSAHPDTRTAAQEVADTLHDRFGQKADLLVAFGSFQHVAAFSDAMNTLRRTLQPGCLLGTTAESILGDDVELDGVSGLSALALRLPEVRVTPWRSTPTDPLPLSKPELLPDRIGLQHDTRCILMLADPFTTPTHRMLHTISNCADPPQRFPIIGGLASGGSRPGINRLILDDTFQTSGAVGVTLSGRMECDFIVSQGCRPVGQPMVVTGVKDQHLITELGGRPALEQLEATASSLPANERSLLQNGLLIGLVVDEHRDHFGRGDFLVRSVLGANQADGAISIGAVIRPGQTVQFQVRDAEAAHDDLQLLLDGQQLANDPFGALLVTCNGRGKSLFGHEGHDITMTRRRLNSPPIAGFFAAGEFGPIGNESYLHGHTAVLTVFRPSSG
ncbi:MAG: FIST C-terminal domain-containing protein [Phycisphaerales bacterium]|nr:FIST C-terminal domain-containing protein [Phycisphaerales bacterium]